MLTKLRLERFKNFQEAELVLGPLTVLVGTNASGKSNLRDAFRFLHGISRGYSLADIIGGKFGEGGERQWTGIRGGPREITYQGAATFALEIFFTINIKGKEYEAAYRIEVDPGTTRNGPSVKAERLVVEGQGDFIFNSSRMTQQEPLHLLVEQAGTGAPGRPPYVTFLDQQPILSQIIVASSRRIRAHNKEIAQMALDTFSSMRFLDLSPDAMRLPSLPGQTVLGDRGENLSSVLQSISAEPRHKQVLIQWVQELTPMDAIDFEFPADQIGRVLVTLVEENGQRTTAYNASDGTLRFLAMIAALLGPESAHFYFFEELDNGIHPTRLHLLLQLIEQQVSLGVTQMVATTHSPQLLRLISPAALEHASLTYRLEGRSNAQIKRILDIPEARRIIAQHDLAQLHESGWLENSVAFLEDEEVSV